MGKLLTGVVPTKALTPFGIWGESLNSSISYITDCSPTPFTRCSVQDPYTALIDGGRELLSDCCPKYERNSFLEMKETVRNESTASA
jgi:hypothetical protein